MHRLLTKISYLKDETYTRDEVIHRS